MEEKKQKNFVVSAEQFSKIVNKLNKIYDNQTDPKFKEKEEKYKNYVFKYVENLVKQDSKIVIESIKELFNIKKEFLEKTGDELIERIWKLYDLKSFEKGNIVIDKDNNFINLVNIFLLFNNFKYFDTLFEIENMKIKQKIAIKKEHLNDLQFKSLGENKNTLIDLFIFFIFSTVELKSFYTSISTFILNTDSCVILLFKTIALFGLCLAQVTKKEDFVASVYFLIGGVLRTHARSYLKTKGILNENLSEICCNKHKQGHHSQFEPKLLTSLECDFLEQYFFMIMIEFIQITTKQLKLNQKWDSYLFIFLKNLELGEMDSDDILPPEISIIHYTILFLSDFAFSFITNFVSFDEKNRLVTKFDNFKEFTDLSISFISFSCHDVINLFLVSDKKKKIQEGDCEKTEYELKDAYNHYGICMFFYLMLSGRFSYKSLKTNEILKSSPLPCVLNKETIASVIKSIIYMFLYSENNSNFSTLKNLRIVIHELITMLLDSYIGNDENLIKNNSLIENILYEFLQVSNAENEMDYIVKIVNIFKDETNILFINLIEFSQNRINFCQTIQRINYLVNSNPKLFKISEIELISVLKSICLNGFILEENVNQSFTKLYNSLKSNINLEKFFIMMKELKEIIKNYDSEKNAKDEEKELIRNNQSQIQFILSSYNN